MAQPWNIGVNIAIILIKLIIFFAKWASLARPHGFVKYLSPTSANVPKYPNRMAEVRMCAAATARCGFQEICLFKAYIANASMDKVRARKADSVLCAGHCITASVKHCIWHAYHDHIQPPRGKVYDMCIPFYVSLCRGIIADIQMDLDYKINAEPRSHHQRCDFLAGCCWFISIQVWGMGRRFGRRWHSISRRQSLYRWEAATSESIQSQG